MTAAAVAPTISVSTTISTCVIRLTMLIPLALSPQNACPMLKCSR
jgi:hypothetical protein